MHVSYLTLLFYDGCSGFVKEGCDKFFTGAVIGLSTWYFISATSKILVEITLLLCVSRMTANFDGVRLADNSLDKSAAPEIKLSKSNSRNALLCYDQCGNKSSTKPRSQKRHAGVGDFHIDVNQIDDFDHTHEGLAGIHRSPPVKHPLLLSPPSLSKAMTSSLIYL
eukprot:SAG11_NODE_1161_length_5638_cov_10.644545_3_plen_166_part_00